MRVLITALVCILLFTGGLFTGRRVWPRVQEVPVEKEEKPSPSDASKKKPPAASASGDFLLTPRKHHYGSVLEGEVRKHKFLLNRPKSMPLRLGRLYSPCPCIFVTTKDRTIGAGQEAMIEVAVHSLTLEGKKSFPFYVEVEKPEKHVLRGDVSIDVKRVPTRLLVKPDTLHLGAVVGSKTAGVKLYNLTSRAVTVKDISCSIKGVKMSIPEGKRIEAGRTATVQLEIPEGSLKVGGVRGEILVETNSPSHSVIRIPVEGSVRKSRSRPAKKEPSPPGKRSETVKKKKEKAAEDDPFRGF